MGGERVSMRSWMVLQRDTATAAAVVLRDYAVDAAPPRDCLFLAELTDCLLKTLWVRTLLRRRDED